MTHSAQVTQALEVAARAWPQMANKPAALLSQLALKGAEALRTEQDAEAARRAALVRTRAGRFQGVYGVDYLAKEREGWLE